MQPGRLKHKTHSPTIGLAQNFKKCSVRIETLNCGPHKASLRLEHGLPLLANSEPFMRVVVASPSTSPEKFYQVTSIPTVCVSKEATGLLCYKSLR